MRDAPPISVKIVWSQPFRWEATIHLCPEECVSLEVRQRVFIESEIKKFEQMPATGQTSAAMETSLAQTILDLQQRGALYWDASQQKWVVDDH